MKYAYAYIYDPAGKVTLTGIDQAVLEWSPPAGSIAYGPATNLNQISTVNGVPLSFDTDGNMTSDGINTYGFDRANRLISAATPAATVTYIYDSDDRRTVKTVNGVTTRTLWSGADELAETDGNGVMLRRFVPSGNGAMDDRAAMVTASTNAVLWFHTDRQGSVIATSGPTGTVTGSRAYSPHGEMGTGLLPPGGVFGYTGRQYDPETGLYQYRARYYSPRLGQFLSLDPIGTKDDPNLYGYVRNDPANYNDPTGMVPGDPFGSIEEAVVDAINFINQTSIDENREYGGSIIFVNGAFQSTIPEHGIDRRVPIRLLSNSVADWHTHGDYSEQRGSTFYRVSKHADTTDADRPSDPDFEVTRSILGMRGRSHHRRFLGTPSGQIFEYGTRSSQTRSVGSSPPSEGRGGQGEFPGGQPTVAECNRAPHTCNPGHVTE